MEPGWFGAEAKYNRRCRLVCWRQHRSGFLHSNLKQIYPKLETNGTKIESKLEWKWTKIPTLLTRRCRTWPGHLRPTSRIEEYFTITLTSICTLHWRVFVHYIEEYLTIILKSIWPLHWKVFDHCIEEYLWLAICAPINTVSNIFAMLCFTTE